MNLVSSKIGRAKINNKVTDNVTVYSIQLYIESFKIVHRGYVYFVWISDTTQIQSLRYEAASKIVQVKETLTITERVSIKNSREQTSTTYLKLVTEDGEELDQCEININTLAPQYKQMEVPMNRGHVLLKARKKQMNIPSEEDLGSPTNYRRRTKGDRPLEGNAIDIQSMQQQLGRVKKELEDEVYLNNKLKNDREVLLATKQDLQLEIQKMTEQITTDIYNLREHYQTKIQIRERCYEEEIQDMVNVFNSSTEQTRKVVELVLKQKLKLEEELKPLHEKLKKNEIQQTDSYQNYKRLQGQKNHVEQSLHEAGQLIIQKDQEIELLSAQKNELLAQTDQLKASLSNSEAEIIRNQQKIANQDTLITSLQQRLNELEFELNNKQMTIKQLSSNLQVSNKKQQQLQIEGGLMVKEISQLQSQKKSHLQQLEVLKGRLQQFEYEMEFNENVMNQLKKQQAQKQYELYGQIEALQQLYSKKIEDIILNHQNEKQQIQSGHISLKLEKQELDKKLLQVETDLQVAQQKLREASKEIQKVSDQLQSSIKSKEQKEKVISSLQRDNLKVKEQNKSLQSQVQRMQQDILHSTQKQGQLSPLLKNYKQELENKDQEVKRLSQKLLSSQKHINFLKQQKEKAELQVQKLVEAKSKGPQSYSVDKNHMQSEFSREAFDNKQQQIVELKGRVEQLQNVYHNLQQKMHVIGERYPEIDKQLLEVPEVAMNCDSEGEEQRNRVHAIPVPPINIAKRPIKRPTLDITSSIRDREQVKSTHRKQSQQNNNSFDRSVANKSMRQSLTAPKDLDFKKEMSASRSDRSGGSARKGSHSKKIKELQDQIKDFLQRQKSYKQQIQQYEQHLNSMKNDIKQKFNLKNNQSNERFLQNKQSQVIIEDARILALSQDNYAKDVEIQKTNYKIGQLEAALKRQKAEVEKKTAMYQKLTMQIAKKEEEYLRKGEGLNDSLKNLQKQLLQLEQKLSKQKQAAYQAKLSIKQLLMHKQNDQNDLKKLRNINETLQDKLQKLAGSDSVIRELNKEVSDLQKKGLEQTRNINHIKLQKDAVEQELRMIKKRQNDQTRIAVQWQEKAAGLERLIQETKRKQNKLKRQIQEGQQDVRRNKLQIKKLEEQIQAFTASQISWQVQRRKHLDEISSLQDQLSRKDYELNKMTKEIEKWRLKFDEKDEVRMGRKSEMRQEIDRLQSELIRKQKKILQENEQNKLLRGRLQLLERENKRIMEQKNQTYGEKLKYYVEQMTNIKKLLEEYQNQNNRLKIQNNELYEQSEIIRVKFDKMQAKYDDCMEREENVLNDLNSYITEVSILKDRLAQAHAQLDHTEAAYANLRKQADQDKLNAKKISEKMEAAERNLERALAQMRELKVRLSEYETSSQINGKIDQKYRQVNRRRQELEEQCKRLKAQYQKVLNLFIYKRQDLEKAVNDARNQQKRIKEEEIQTIRQQCNKIIVNKTQRLQQEILDVYNDSTKLRAEIQALHEENSKQKARIYQLQSILDKIGPIQTEYDNIKNVTEEIRTQVRKKADQINKMQIQIERAQSQNNMKQRQLNAIRSRLQQLERINQKTNQEIKVRKNAQSQLQESLMKLSMNKDQYKEQQQYNYKQREARLVQQYQIRINNYETDLKKAKDKEIQTVEENAAKMKKLQAKLDQMQSALKQRQIAIQAHYEDQMVEMENSLIKASQELQQKILRIEELTNAVYTLQAQNKNLNRELQQLNYRAEDQRQAHESQLSKMKSKLKQTEISYANNLKSLEEQFSRASQVKNGNISTSRVKTNDLQDKIAKRYEQKLKMKDRRIEQLKENIFTLEQTIVKLRKKQNNYESTLLQVERIKISFAQLEKQRKDSQARYQDQLSRNTDAISELKKQNLGLKENQQKWRLKLQERNLQYQSMESEVKTLRELYQQLQKQLQKRKRTLTSEMQEQNSLLGQLKTQQNKIFNLQDQIAQKNAAVKELQLQVKKKNEKIRKINEALEQYKKSEEKLRNQINKATAELNASKKINQQLDSTCEQSKGQLRQTKNQLARLKKIQEDLRSNSSNKEQTLIQFKKINEELSLKLKDTQQAARRYSILNERSRKHLGFGIDQIVDRYITAQQETEDQINQLIQEIEELKFLNQRKFLDFDQLKKENLQLQIKVQDLDILSEQVDTLRKICDKLQEEKKNTVFREEVLRMQIQNLASTGSAELRARIEYILANPPVPSYGSFSFYQK